MGHTPIPCVHVTATNVSHEVHAGVLTLGRRAWPKAPLLPRQANPTLGRPTETLLQLLTLVMDSAQVFDSRATRATEGTPSPDASGKPYTGGADGKPWYNCTPEELAIPLVPREALPQPAEPPVKMNLWNLAKDLVGKASLDLHRISVPV